MYCTNCGKEIKSNYKYCKNCGSIVEGENINADIEDKPKELGMKYYNFFSKIYLVIIVAINVLAMANYNNVENWNIYILIQLLLDILIYIVLPIKLSESMQKQTEITYKLLITFLILDYIYKVVLVSINCYINNPYIGLATYIITILIIYGIWFIPNIIYFTKRRKIFKN